MEPVDELDDELRRAECELAALAKRMMDYDVGIAGLLRGARVLVGEARDWLALEDTR